MTSAGRAATLLLLLVAVAPVAAGAQQADGVTPQDATSPAGGPWIVIGSAFGTVRGGCQTCEEDFPYRHAASLLANAGYRINGRTALGAEVFWMPVDTDSGWIQTTHLDGVIQVRPWGSAGFFFKLGAGMAFVRNWIDLPEARPVTSKALSVVTGAGWTFRTERRVGVQLFGAQHAAALGDLQTIDGPLNDVLGNFWSAGAALVIR